MKAARPIARIATGAAPAGILLIVAAAFRIAWPGVGFTLLDAQTIAVHTIIVGTAALGMTLVIISGGLDLSVGSGVALTGVAAALLAAAGSPLWVAGIAAVGLGAVCGAYNGLLVTVLRIPPFIATLGTLGFFRGVAKWLSGSSPVNADPGVLGAWVRPTPSPGWLVLAPGVWLMLGLAGLTAWALRSTVAGRRVVAVGSNAEAARRCGIRIGRTRLAVYAAAGLFTGLAGLMQFARVTQGDPTIAAGMELDVIAAVVIGGASLAGGRGSILGTVCGAVLMAYLRNRSTALGWPNFVQEMIVGHVIIAAVALDFLRRRGA